MFNFEADLRFAQDHPVMVVDRRRAGQNLNARRRDIYDSHRHRAFALAYYMTGNELEAEQILTGTFVRAFQAAQEPTGQDVDFALLEELRQRSCLVLNPAATASLSQAHAADSSGNLTTRNVKRTELEEAIWGLPTTERLLFLLRDVEGYTSAAIAQLLAMPEPQVQHDVFAARIHLRQLLAAAQANRAVAA